jgi:dTDP-4-dehydrorhamnose 3,5-epimerase
MIYHRTSLQEAMLIDLERRTDSRGYFARTMCQTEFKENGLVWNFVQSNLSYNRSKGTLRGMHFQEEPFGEVKLVQCVRGAIYDVIVDRRPASSTFMNWEGFELTEENGRSLYVPVGFAHGYLTLVDDAAVSYQVSTPYTPRAEFGFRYDDPTLSIKWPLTVSYISDKDASWPLLPPPT